MQSHELNLPTSPSLGATLVVPDEPKLAALVVQGSGVHDRDGNMHAFGFKSTLYRRVSRELASRASVASLRFDKRGSERQAGDTFHYSIPERLEDLRAALSLLREHPRTAGLPLFLVGHSEGAMLAAKLAEAEPVQGVVSLAAPYGNTFALGRERARRLLELGGAHAARGELALEYYDRLEEFFTQGARILPEEYREFAKPYRGAPWLGWESFEWLAGHWAGTLESDPTGRGVPMLVVQGGRDARVWKDNSRRWQAWCADRILAEFRLVEHMGHDLNDAGKKAFRLDDTLLDTICSWMESSLD